MKGMMNDDDDDDCIGNNVDEDTILIKEMLGPKEPMCWSFLRLLKRNV